MHEILEEFYKYLLYRVYITDNSLVAECNDEVW